MQRLTISEVINAIKPCVDPELGVSIVDIGLLYGIKIGENNDINLRMTMTSPMCPVTSIILADVQLRLEQLPGVGQVKIELVWEPLWNPDMISASMKTAMGV